MLQTTYPMNITRTCSYRQSVFGTKAKDETTAIAKKVATNKNCIAIDNSHKLPQYQYTLAQQGCDVGYRIRTALQRASQSLNPNKKGIGLPPHTMVILSLLTTIHCQSHMIQVQTDITSVKRTNHLHLPTLQ